MNEISTNINSFKRSKSRWLKIKMSAWVLSYDPIFFPDNQTYAIYQPGQFWVWISHDVSDSQICMWLLTIDHFTYLDHFVARQKIVQNQTYTL